MGPDLETLARSAFDRWIKPELPSEIASKATIDGPVAIQQDKAFSHWMINVRAEGRIVGSMDFSLDGTLQRYEARLTPETTLNKLEIATAELAPSNVRTLAASSVGEGALVESEPVLVAHGAPTKLAWQVAVKDKKGVDLQVFVTPKYIWREGD